MLISTVTNNSSTLLISSSVFMEEPTPYCCINTFPLFKVMSYDKMVFSYQYLAPQFLLSHWHISGTQI